MLATTPKLPEARHVVGVDVLDVRDVMPMVAGFIGRPGGLYGVEREPDGGVLRMAWKCAWKPRRSRPMTASRSRSGSMNGVPGPSIGSLVRRVKVGGPRLEDAVEHGVTLSAQPTDGRGPIRSKGSTARALSPLPPQCADHPRRQPAGRGRLAVDGERLRSDVASCQAVIPSGWSRAWAIRSPATRSAWAPADRGGTRG